MTQGRPGTSIPPTEASVVGLVPAWASIDITSVFCHRRLLRALSPARPAARCLPWVPTMPSTSAVASLVRAPPPASLLLAAIIFALCWGGGGIAPLGGSTLHSAPLCSTARSEALSVSFGSRWCSDQFRREVKVEESEASRRRRLKESSSAVLGSSKGELVVDRTLSSNPLNVFHEPERPRGLAIRWSWLAGRASELDASRPAAAIIEHSTGESHAAALRLLGIAPWTDKSLFASVVCGGAIPNFRPLHHYEAQTDVLQNAQSDRVSGCC